MAHIREHLEAILNERSMHTYFLHRWDAMHMKMLVFLGNVYWNLHESFWFGQNSPFLYDPVVRAQILTPSWFMYELTGTAPELNEGEFLPQMTAHHVQCLSCTGEGSPTKNYSIYVPSLLSGLHQPRMDSSTTILMPSSTSLPSLAYPGNATASSSSVSSRTSWYPQHTALQSPQDEHYAPYVPDNGHHTGHGKMPWCQQPPNYIWQNSKSQAKESEVALHQGDGPSSMQYDDDDDLYFNAAGSTGALAGWAGNYTGS
ncbi:hypothetical protein BDR04DRAFT_1118754 [Suillus decipiens]|nr:hypothetical protein BDR04DRAFT_1118754 [Suillus decipiens]